MSDENRILIVYIPTRVDINNECGPVRADAGRIITRAVAGSTPVGSTNLTVICAVGTIV